MSEAVPAAIVTAIFLAVTSITYFLLTDVWHDHSVVLTELSMRLEAQTETGISIGTTGVADSDLDCSNFTVQVENTGNTSIADFSTIDVLVEYVDENGAEVVSYLEYITDWTITGFAPDYRDPGAWNPGETATFVFSLDSLMQMDTPANLVAVMPQGVSDLIYFSCVLNLFLHSETQDISATNYYRLKTSAADGAAATISSAIPAGQTGRFAPSSNNGKFVFPFTSTSRIQASTWTVTYRVKREQADFGFVWLTNATDISLTTIGSWQDIDLSGAVPVEATGAIVEIVNTGGVSSFSGVVRGKADSRDYMSDPAFEEIAAEAHRWQIVQVDGNRLIQGFIEDTSIDFKLLGYTIGADPAYFATPPDVTPGTTGSWTTVDVSSQVDADADGVILFIDSISAGDQDYGIREVGSGFSTTNLELEEYGNTMYLVGIDGSARFEAYIESADVKLYLVGQTKGSVVYYTDDILITDPTTGSWQSIDADTYAVSTDANGLIFRAENTSFLVPQSHRISVRHGDSTDDWNGDISSGTHFQMAVGINDSNVWDEFMDGLLGLPNDDVDVYVGAYTRLVNMEVHADLDLLVRQADGTVRTTLATEVASTVAFTGAGWQTLTATYVFPGYTAVSQTDYLEIDLFAHATTNASGESSSVDFRIDDPALPLEDQAQVEF